jgi:hypothetical protein
MTSQAGHAAFTFDTDPAGYMDFFGHGYWNSDGGNPGGYIVLFDAIASQKSTIIFDDFDNGTIVKGFTFQCDLKVGDGTDSPADGFSVNYAHGNDPVVVNHNGSGFAASPGNEADLPEEGTQTGLGVGFDSWDSGSGDVIGISVRVENVLKTQIPLTTKNGDPTDWTSLQTGHKTSDNNGSLLTWQPLKLDLAPGGVLNIWWKGHQVVTNYATGYKPGTGRLIFAGRSGGSFQRCYVDNIVVDTLPADGPEIASATAAPQGVIVTMPDVGSVTLKSGSVSMTVDGVAATTSVVKAGTISYVTGKTPNYLLFGSTHTVVTTWTDSNNTTSSDTNTVTVSGYPFYGFLDHNSSANLFVEAEDFNFDSGKFIDNPVHDGFAGDNSYMDRVGVEDIDRHNPTEGSAGHAYRAYDAGTAIGETVGTEANGDTVRDAYVGFTDYDVGWTDNGEWENYTRTFPAGKYRVYARLATGNGGPFTEKLEMVVGDTTTTSQTAVSLGTLPFDSTGGWQAYKSYPLLDAYGNEVVLPISGKTTFRFTQVTGGANLNFYMFVPVTDAGTLRPYVTAVSPTPNATGVVPGPKITANIASRETMLTTSSVKIALNGTDMTSAATITATPIGASVLLIPGLLPQGSSNTVTITYTDSASVSQTNTWSFVVGTGFPVLPAGAIVPAGQINKSLTGFNGYVYQTEITRPGADANVLPAPLNGLYGLFTNADTQLQYANQAGVDGGIFTEPGVVNYNVDTALNAGPFTPNVAFPGIPGWTSSTENFVVECTTYLDLKVGSYTLAVSSDDGFLVSCGADSRDSLLTPVGIANVGRGNVESAFTVVAPVAGLYPFRLVYWQGGGGGNVSFYSIDEGTRILINDTTNPNAIRAYRGFTGTARPYVAFNTIKPAFDQGGVVATGVLADTSISAGFTNLGSATPVLYVNDTQVSTTKTSDNGITTLTYTPSALFPSGSTNTVAWVYANTTNSYQFVVTSYPTLDPNLAVDGDPDPATAGFKVKFVKSGNVTGLENTVARMEAQLAGTLVVGTTKVTDVAPAGPLSGYYNLSILNLNIMKQTNVTEQGSFTTATGYPDQDFPAIPGNLDATAVTNYEDFAMEAVSYVKLPAGYLRLCVNSDDGFRVTCGSTYNTNDPVLGVYDGGKGASDVVFTVLTTAAGWYPIRLAYEQGGGGANCEFFSIAQDGTKTLINSTAAGAFPAYYTVNSTAFTGRFTSIKPVGNNIVITYTSGVLQSAPAVTGPWTDITTATSPYTTPNTGTTFFRLHK